MSLIKRLTFGGCPPLRIKTIGKKRLGSFIGRDGEGPNLSFQPERSGEHNGVGIHLDLYTDKQKQEVNRLPRLGARRYPWSCRPGSTLWF
jgi:Glyoxalase-like domain